MDIENQNYGKYHGTIHTHEIDPHNVSDAHYILDYPEQFSEEQRQEAINELQSDSSDLWELN